MSRMNEGSTATQLKDKASEMTSNIKDKASEITGNIKDAATEQLHHARETASEYYDQGRAKAQEWERSLEEYVPEQPMKALMIAAGVGIVLGILWKRS